MSICKTIGITGNSGSGKSSVSKILADYGAYTINADEIAHRVMQPSGAAYNAVLQLFGTSILNIDKTINRKLLSTMVFSDNELLQKHTKITHYYIIKEIENELTEARKKQYKYIVVDAPLLIEANLHKIVDSVWVVYADYEVRLARILKRDKITEEAAKLRLNSQMHFDEMKKYADFILINEASEESLKNQVDIILRKC